MIEFTKSYKTVDGKLFDNINEAQIHEIELILEKSDSSTSENAKFIAVAIFKNKDLILDILTTNPNSKPKARAIHGGTKKRVKGIVSGLSPTPSPTT